jgi:hypothetical protein
MVHRPHFMHYGPSTMLMEVVCRILYIILILWRSHMPSAYLLLWIFTCLEGFSMVSFHLPRLVGADFVDLSLFGGLVSWTYTTYYSYWS